MRIPTQLTLDQIRDFARDTEQRLNALENSDIDMGQRRVVNAGTSISKFDYVTRFELDQLKENLTKSKVPAGILTPKNLTMSGASTDNGIVRFDGTTGNKIQNTSGPILEDDGTIALLVDPIDAQDAATKAYVDAHSGSANVVAKTNGSGAPYSVSATTDLGKTFTNEGATAEVYFALPTAATSVGPYTFTCQDSDLLRVTADTGDTIRLYDNVSASAGYVQAVGIGSSVTIVAINATEWLAVAMVGEWNVN